mgnify:FL=1
MKGYKQIHLIARDRSFKYEPIENIPEFYSSKEALKYWKYNEKRLMDCNFYGDPIVLIRVEIHSVAVENLGWRIAIGENQGFKTL